MAEDRVIAFRQALSGASSNALRFLSNTKDPDLQIAAGGLLQEQGGGAVIDLDTAPGSFGAQREIDEIAAANPDLFGTSALGAANPLQKINQPIYDFFGDAAERVKQWQSRYEGAEPLRVPPGEAGYEIMGKALAPIWEADFPDPTTGLEKSELDFPGETLTTPTWDESGRTLNQQFIDFRRGLSGKEPIQPALEFPTTDLEGPAAGVGGAIAEGPRGPLNFNPELGSGAEISFPEAAAPKTTANILGVPVNQMFAMQPQTPADLRAVALRKQSKATEELAGATEALAQEARTGAAGAGTALATLRSQIASSDISFANVRKAMVEEQEQANVEREFFTEAADVADLQIDIKYGKLQTEYVKKLQDIQDKLVAPTASFDEETVRGENLMMGLAGGLKLALEADSMGEFLLATGIGALTGVSAATKEIRTLKMGDKKLKADFDLTSARIMADIVGTKAAYDTGQLDRAARRKAERLKTDLSGLTQRLQGAKALSEIDLKALQAKTSAATAAIDLMIRGSELQLKGQTLGLKGKELKIKQEDLELRRITAAREGRIDTAAALAASRQAEATLEKTGADIEKLQRGFTGVPQGFESTPENAGIAQDARSIYAGGGGAGGARLREQAIEAVRQNNIQLGLSGTANAEKTRQDVHDFIFQFLLTNR